ncbi:MAG: hypothetical protein ACOCWQ_05995 [Nanoarchaeota archaeon]
MAIHDVISVVEESVPFAEWKAQHPDAYLAHVFVMVEGTVTDEWQVGYVDGGKVIPFKLSGDKVLAGSEEKIFKKPGESVHKLDAEAVSVEVIDAVEMARTHCEEKFPHDPVKKAICILQDLPDEGAVWNITFVTLTIKTINVRVDAASKEIRKAEVVEFFQWGK